MNPAQLSTQATIPTMNEVQPGIPAPEAALTTFRAGRVAASSEAIRPAADGFAAEVSTSAAGVRSAQDSIKALTRAFVASYRALSEAQEAAKAAGVVTRDTSSALTGVLGRIKAEFGEGIGAMKESVARLEAHAPGDFGDFCKTAHEKISRLDTFWQQTTKSAPSMRM